MDEFCQWPSTTNAKGVWTAILTSMGKVPGAKLLCTTTSGDPAHWSHAVYETALKSKAWTVQEVPGPLPWASEDFLAEQRLILPESVYRRLHLNEWSASEDRLTNLDDVRACVTLGGPLEWQEGRQYVLALDLGVRNDRNGGGRHAPERMVEPGGRDVVQRMVLDRMEVWAGTHANPVDLGAVEWVEFTARAYRARVVCDPWQAIAMVQRLRSRGLQVEEFNFSQQSTGRLAVALHTTIRDHRLAIPDDPELIDELVNVRLKETSPNVYRLDHDPDRHDDPGGDAGHGDTAAGDQGAHEPADPLHRRGLGPGGLPRHLHGEGRGRRGRCHRQPRSPVRRLPFGGRFGDAGQCPPG